MNSLSSVVNPRKELLDKLHNKIKLKHNDRFKPSQQKVEKIKKDIKLEKKKNDEDPRVTKLMKDYFVHALQTYTTYDLVDPHTILENKDKYTLKFLNFSIKLLKNNNNNLDILNNPYCNYMREVLGIN